MKIEKRYWDSNCFLGYLKGESDKESACRAVLNEAKNGRIIIVTSALTLAEVVKLKGEAPVPVEDSLTLEKAFKQDYIRLRNVNSHIAELARKMVWEYGFDPKDSIHVATAIEIHIAFFDTFDKDLIRLNGAVGNPPMRIGIPNVDYQTELFSQEEELPDAKK